MNTFWGWGELVLNIQTRFGNREFNMNLRNRQTGDFLLALNLLRG